MPELKPCPFCGGKAKVSSGWIGRMWCECSDDDCPAILQDTEEEAIAAWNTRPNEARIRRETIEECALVLTEKSYAFCGINASVAGALHTAARELLDMIEVDHAGTELPTMEG